MSLYNNKEIEEMNFEELRAEVSSMRHELTKYKRLLDLFTEDIENSALGKSLTMENGKLRTQIKAVAGEISTKVENTEKDLSSQITQMSDEIASKVSASDMESAINQKAESITADVREFSNNVEKRISKIELNNQGLRSYVARAAKLSEATEVSSTEEMTDTDAIYVIRDRDDGNILSETYYYYDIATEDWEEASEETIYTVFEQDSGAFRLKGNVKISGDLIADGVIDGIRLQSKTLNESSTAIACLDKGFIYLLSDVKDNDGLAKFRVGMYEARGTHCPYMLFGAGDGDEGIDFDGNSAPLTDSTMLFEKDTSGFVMSYRSSDGTTNSIRFWDSNMPEEYKNKIDFTNASIRGLKVTFG